MFRFLALALALTFGTTLGLAGAALGTGNGRSVLVGALLGIANRTLRGTVTIESLAGSLYQGLLVQGVRLVGHDGRPLIDIGTLNLRYRFTDLLSRRIVLGQLELSRARVNLEQRRGERFNYQTVLRLGEGTGGGGRGPLVAFRNVRLTDVAIVIRTPSSDDTSRVNERHVTVPAAHLSYVRVSSPFPGEGAVVFDVAGIRGRIDRPALDIRDARGRVEVLGDTVTFDLDRARLPGTRTAMQGRLWSLGDGPRFDLDFTADRFRGADVRDFVPWLPTDATGRGRLAVASPVDDRVDVDARELRLTMGDSGTVRGSLALHLGPGEAWTAEAVDLVSANFDLAYLRGLFDSLPMDGRLTGRTQARGPSTGVTVDLRWRFFDRRADSAETGLGGSGIVIFGADEGITFREFQVDSAAVALATVREMSPGVALTGTLDAVGRLDGPLLNATFQGTLAHRKDTLPVSRALGDIRLDLRGDTAAVWGTLEFDSVAWDGIRPDYPQVPFLGAMAGEVRLAGPMDAMRLDLALQGPRGGLSGGGTVILMAPHLGARDLDLRFSGLELLPVERRLPRTAFSGTVRGMVEGDTLVPTRMDVALALGPSRLGGTLVDSVRAGLRVQDDMLAVDTLRVWLRGIALSGSGGLALNAPGSDTLVLRLEADSLVALAPLVLGLVGRDTLALARDTLRGTVVGTVTASGALDALEAAWSLDGARVGLNQIEIHGARAGGEWSSTAAGRMAIRVEVDSLLRRDRRFDGVTAEAAGTRDSVHWQFRSAIGVHAAVRGGGVWVRRASWEIRPDSLVVDAADERWTLADGAAVHVTDSTVGIRGVSLATGSGRSRLTLSGTVPRTGSGRFEGAVEALPLSHLWALLQRDPGDAAGLLSGTFRVGGGARDPVIDVSFSLRDAVFDEFHAPLTDGTVTYASRRLTGTLNMWRSGVRVLGVDVELPLDLGFIDVRRRRLPGPLSVRARAEGVDLALLSATSPIIRETEGRLWADMGLTGEWERPELTGYLEVRDGAATFPALGVRHRQLNGRLTLAGDSIRVDSLSAWSGTGYASVRGVVRLEALSRPVLDLTIEASEFRAMDDPDFLTLTASGTLDLDGPVVGAVLRGSGTVTRGALHIADIIEKELVNLDPLMVDSATAAIIRRQRLGPDFESRFLDSLRIEDLRLRMGADVHLRSTEADILLSGDVLVGKIGDRYRIDGTLRTPRGTYDLYLGPTIRRRFSVTRGEVRYFGTPDLNAALDIDARHQLRGARGEDVTVFVHVGGTILEPELRLSSDVRPTLSEAEVINYLVFGAPNAQAVTGDVGAYGVQQSVTSLTGQISGQISSALIADLGVPLDYLEFRPQFGGQSGVAAEIAGGLRLSDRVFVTVSPRFCRKQAFTVQNLGGTVEFELGSGWSLLASADPVRVCNLSGTAGFGQQLQLGLDLFWERRF